MKTDAAGETEKTGTNGPGPHFAPKGKFWAFASLLAVIVILANLIVSELGARYGLQIDLTSRAVYRLDRQTISMLEELDKDVEIFVLAVRRNFTGAPYMMQALNIIEQYPRHSPRVALSFVDYAADPAFASRFPRAALETGSILAVCGDRMKQLKLSDLFNFTLNPEGTSMVIGSSRAEEALTGAISGVISDIEARCAILTGNGAAVPKAFASLLESNGYITEEVNLAASGVGGGFALAVLCGPDSDYAENELDKLDEFLYDGGRFEKTLLYTADAASPALPNLEAFLREWGVSVEDGAVFETDARRTYQYVPFYPIADYSDIQYKNMLSDAASPFLMPMARRLRAVFEFRDSYAARTLLEFGASAVVRPSGAPAAFTADDAEVRGPLPALVLAERRAAGNGPEAARSCVLVSASTGMLDDFCVQNASLSNGEYLLNVLNSLTGREKAVSITPKSLAGRNLSIPTQAVSLLGIVLMGAIPAVTLAAGLAVWLRRRFS